MNTQSPYRMARGRLGENAFPFGGFGGGSAPGQSAVRMAAFGLAGLNVGINKQTFLVGDAPNYVITGAAPNTAVLWSSTKNGQPTGENQAQYGNQTTDANGNSTGSGGPWTSNDIGTWTKTATVGGENYTVAFTVVPLNATSTTSAGTWIPYYAIPGNRQTAPAAADNINVFGYDLPRIPFYIAVAALAFYLVKGKK